MSQLPAKVKEQLELLLAQAVDSDAAQMGTIQLYRKNSQTLDILVQKGFGEDFLEYFKIVKALDTSVSGRAIGIATTVVVSDVNLDIPYAPHLPIARSAGFRAVKAVPLYSDTQLLGVISTYFAEPRWNWDLKKQTLLHEELADILLTVQDMTTSNSR